MPVPLRRLAPLALYALWILVTLYPNPALLVRAIPHALDPKIDADAVRHVASELPDDPARIEALVLGTHVPYAVPWQTHGVPWYFPTTREVVERGAGDCQARMLFFASVLEAKHIPYKLQASFDHIWVEYARKRPNAMEMRQISLMEYADGKRTLQLPEQWDWSETYRIEKEYFWDAMPQSRKLLLFCGLAFIFLTRRNLKAIGGLRAPSLSVRSAAPAYALNRIEYPPVVRRRE